MRWQKEIVIKWSQEFEQWQLQECTKIIKLDEMTKGNSNKVRGQEFEQWQLQVCTKIIKWLKCVSHKLGMSVSVAPWHI